MVLKSKTLNLTTALLGDGIDAWDNDYIKFNMKKLESEYGVHGENKIKFRLFSTKHASSCIVLCRSLHSHAQSSVAFVFVDHMPAFVLPLALFFYLSSSGTFP